MGFQMVEPLDRDPVFEIKSKEKDFMVIGRETDCIKLDNAVDFTKEGCNFFMFATEHTRIANFNRGTQPRSVRLSLGLTQNLHDTLLKCDLVVGENTKHASEVGEVLRLG